MVDLLAHGLNRMIEPLLLGGGILRHQLLHDNSRLMQKHMPEAHAFAERRADQGHWLLQTELWPGWASDCNSPEAIISASNIAVVWSASTSSSE